MLVEICREGAIASLTGVGSAIACFEVGAVGEEKLDCLDPTGLGRGHQGSEASLGAEGSIDVGGSETLDRLAIAGSRRIDQLLHLRVLGGKRFSLRKDGLSKSLAGIVDEARFQNPVVAREEGKRAGLEKAVDAFGPACDDRG